MPSIAIRDARPEDLPRVQEIYAHHVLNGLASFEETLKGSIKRGKFADFVVLSDDPRSVPALELKDVAVEETWVAGRMRYTALP